MSEERASPIVIDANSLIDLIKLGALIPVTKKADYRFLVVDEVVGEIRWPGQAKILESAIERGSLFRVSLCSTEELALFTRLQAVLDLGESASLAYASLYSCLLLSDETQRAFMREVTAFIGEKRLVRTPSLLARAIECHIVSLSGLEARLEMLKGSATGPRDKDDIGHLRRVLDRVRLRLKGG